MYTIKDIKIKELQGFINSKEYRELEHIPISRHRAFSYINNPRVNSKDIAITLLYIKDILVAYRCLYSDFLFLNNKKYNFSWISGSWVHPDFRRKGYSMILLKHCILAKNGHLMFSNYAPESKSLYDKSGQFSEITNLKGHRIYFRFSFAELLPPKHSFFKKTKPVLFITDYFLNFYFDIRFFLKNIKTNNINFHKIDKIDSETNRFIEKHNVRNPFKRNGKELNHAISFPWIVQTKHSNKNDNKYFFSSSAEVFKNIMLKIYNKDMQISAFLFLIVKNKSLTIPYLFFDDRELSKLVKIILFYVKTYKINYLTSFNTRINKEILKQKTFVLFSKNMQKIFFAGNKMKNHFDASNCFFAGDGDSLYT